MSPHCVWIVTVGGAGDNRFVTNPNIAMLTELGQCIMMMYGLFKFMSYVHVLHACVMTDATLNKIPYGYKILRV